MVTSLSIATEMILLCEGPTTKSIFFAFSKIVADVTRSGTEKYVLAHLRARIGTKKCRFFGKKRRCRTLAGT